ncbi:adenosine deaminase [Arthrobacter sp. B2a2-09]
MPDTIQLARPVRSGFISGLPKAEIHCHLAGTLRIETLRELAAKNGVFLVNGGDSYDPRYQPHAVASLQLLDTVVSTIKDRDDFARVAYEAQIDAFTNANIRYRELFFNPTQHGAFWATPYSAMVDGLIDGLRQAEKEVGIGGRLIPSINREQSPAVATQLVQAVIDNPRDEVVGIGMDANEMTGPPEAFQEAFRLAGKHGIRRTAHAGEWALPRNVGTTLDLLHCERLDHAYLLASDRDLMARVAGSGMHIAACWSTSLYHGWENSPENPIAAMKSAGISVSLNTDDPAVDQTNLNDEYAMYAHAVGASEADLEELTLDVLDHIWVDETERRSLKSFFAAEISAHNALLRSPARVLRTTS